MEFRSNLEFTQSHTETDRHTHTHTHYIYIYIYSVCVVRQFLIWPVGTAIALMFQSSNF